MTTPAPQTGSVTDELSAGDIAALAVKALAAVQTGLSAIADSTSTERLHSVPDIGLNIANALSAYGMSFENALLADVFSHHEDRATDKLRALAQKMDREIASGEDLRVDLVRFDKALVQLGESLPAIFISLGDPVKLLFDRSEHAHRENTAELVASNAELGDEINAMMLGDKSAVFGERKAKISELRKTESEQREKIAENEKTLAAQRAEIQSLSYPAGKIFAWAKHQVTQHLGSWRKPIPLTCAAAIGTTLLLSYGAYLSRDSGAPVSSENPANTSVQQTADNTLAKTQLEQYKKSTIDFLEQVRRNPFTKVEANHVPNVNDPGSFVNFYTETVAGKEVRIGIRAFSYMKATAVTTENMPSCKAIFVTAEPPALEDWAVGAGIKLSPYISAYKAATIFAIDAAMKAQLPTISFNPEWLKPYGAPRREVSPQAIKTLNRPFQIGHYSSAYSVAYDDNCVHPPESKSADSNGLSKVLGTLKLTPGLVLNVDVALGKGSVPARVTYSQPRGVPLTIEIH